MGINDIHQYTNSYKLGKIHEIHFFENNNSSKSSSKSMSKPKAFYICQCVLHEGFPILAT